MKDLLEKYLDCEILVRKNSHGANNSYTLTGVSDDYFTIRKNSVISEVETLHLPYASVFKAVETDSKFVIELNDLSTINHFTINMAGELVTISKKLDELESELEGFKKNSDSIKSTVGNIQGSMRYI
ncbi:MAG: hypothetical protein IJL02_05985 [Methanobrevibacter sp.]|uniref:hypothetical protein n=1 Tax=Methanobrevibacter sp. TaxID=66852 RepID=UPI0025E089D6|nr:hypothetical protein [Methanobrevibacter sp.]MBQ6099397.1 hypothetical protein [Methanobrevibacter sp.]